MSIHDQQRKLVSPSRSYRSSKTIKCASARISTRHLCGLALPLCGVAVLILSLTFILNNWFVTSAAANRTASRTGTNMTEAAESFVKTLTDEQLELTVYEYDARERLGWHFIPKNERKGFQVKNMSEAQRAAAFQLLRQALSESGYSKTQKIMRLESLLAELEKDRRGGNIRDSERYYVTLFGDVAPDQRWGLSFEGHHLSLNFVVEGERVISSTPTFFATNPAIVKEAVLDFPAGLRVLDKEESLAFELIQSLSDDQRKTAIIAEKAFSEIRAAGEPHAPSDEAVGIKFDDLTEAQQKLLDEIVNAYASAVPEDVHRDRLDEIKRNGGMAELKFAWAGADRPGVGHYYRIEGPTMLIEFVNTQPDAAGNPANHIHCVWRDPRGDFALPVGDAAE